MKTVLTIDGALEIGNCWVDSNGYARKSVRGRGEVFAHRYVMERFIGRPLTDIEVVHHVNRDRADNRIENLFLCRDQAHHRAVHVYEDCLAAGYDPDLYKWCSYHREYELKENFGLHRARCKEGTNEFRKLKGYTSEFDWKAKMHQQSRRAVKKGIASPLKEGRGQ